MKQIYFLGECMIELRSIGESTMHQSFAGDVYNSAVYLKRCFSDVNASIVTAVGEDNLSAKMLDVFAGENIDTRFAFKHPSKVAGMYLIETDDTGERSFTYWRSDSAARKVVEFLSDEVMANFAEGDMFFLSGISLAVIEESARETFWKKLETLSNSGVKVVFDPNYRARLWRDESQAKAAFERAFELADMALPGIEDLAELYGIDDADGVLAFCERFNLDEVVVKNGPESVITQSQGQVLTHDITPVSNVVDTTSAGDAFNGVYLGARLSGQSISESVEMAAVAAGTVIQYPGAIIPKQAFDGFLK